jgi:Flp pilus assembly pilin Flp
MLWYVGVLVDVLRGRIATLREDENRDLGASALEWAIIAAISVVIASIIGAVVYNVVKDKGTSLKNCANQAVGASCAP